MAYSSPLICPICQKSLQRIGRTVRCANAHTFDIAREGYVNLLILRRKPKILGDSKEMLVARRAFFDAQHYQPLAAAIYDTIYDEIVSPVVQSKKAEMTILDAGCGEGYFVGQLANHLQQRFPATPIEGYGIDISKDAIKLAAKRYPHAQFAVADLNRQIPLGGATVNVLLNLFAPRNPAEFARVLIANGLLLIVIPADDHLTEVRAKFNLLDIQRGKRQRITDHFSRLMEPLPTRKVRYTLQLGNQDLTNLVRMTPNYWHLTDEAERALAEVGQLETTVSFELLGFRK